MTNEQRDRMIHRFTRKMVDPATSDAEARVCKVVLVALCYMGSVRTVNRCARFARAFT